MKEQIEKMANDIWYKSDVLLINDAEKLAEQLYADGYRKQSEWISVEDRLPEARKQVLLYSPTDGFNIGFMYEDKRFYVGKPYPDRPTHWMPLPSAPEMKGE